MNINPLARKAFAEFLGVAFFLTAIMGATSNPGTALAVPALATVLGLVILMTASISGGHLNPAVSIYFYSRKQLSLTELFAYVGAQLVGALPRTGGLDAGAMLAQPRKAYLLFNTEPVLDAANPSQAAAALAGAEMVVAFSPFSANVEHADVLLPIAPFTETGGAFVNAEGRVQSFHGVVRPLGETRPGWKVLRVLGTMLGLPNFAFDTIEEVRAAALPTGRWRWAIPTSSGACRSSRSTARASG